MHFVAVDLDTLAENDIVFFDTVLIVDPDPDVLNDATNQGLAAIAARPF